MVHRILSLLLVSLHIAITSSELIVDEAFVDNAVLLGELSLAAKTPPDSVADASFYRRGTGESASYMVLNRGGTCYGALDGDLPSTFSSLIDRFLALFSFNFDYMDDFMAGCTVQTPVLRQYQEIGASLEEDVRACVASCIASDCPLTLTGHGGGGGLAAVLGIAVADLDPDAYTFGSVAAIGSECPALDSSKWHRFINVIESQLRRPWGYPPGGLAYDFIPLSYDPIPYRLHWPAEHFGWHLTLSYNFTIASLGLDDTRSLQLTYEPAHQMTWSSTPVFDEDAGYPEAGYLDRLRFLQARFSGLSSYPLPLGYGHRDLCTVDDECGVCESFECDEPRQLECYKSCFLCPPRCDDFQ